MRQKDANKLENRQHLSLLANLASSVSGISAFYVFLLYVSYTTFGSAWLTGLIDGISSLALLFNPLFGSLIDRSGHLRIIAALASVVRVLAVLSVALSLYSGNRFLIVLSLMLSSLAVGLSSDLVNSVRSAWMQNIIRGKFRRRTSINQTVGTVGEIVGYVSVGIFLNMGNYIPLLIVGLIFSVSIIMLPYGLSIPHASRMQEKGIIMSSYEGIRYVFRERNLRFLMIIYIAVNFLLGSLGVIFTVRIVSGSSLPAMALSIPFIFLALGIVGGSLIASRLEFNVFRSTPAIILTAAVILVFLALFNSIPAIVLSSMMLGVDFGIFAVNGMTHIREHSDSSYIARTAGMITSLSQGATFASGFTAGYLISFSGLRESLIMLGAAFAAFALLTAAMAAKIKK